MALTDSGELRAGDAWKRQSLILALLFWVFILSGLYLSSKYSYLLFHTLAEGFSIVIAACIFLFAWNLRGLLANGYLSLLGIAYLFVASIDLVHTLAYSGMGVFHGYKTNLPTQLWLCARLMESISLFIAPFFTRRRINATAAIFYYSLVTALMIAAAFADKFPACFIEGQGLTLFKKVCEYVICLILAGAVFTLARRKTDFDGRTFRLLLISIAFTMASELAFTDYISPYGFANMVGHYLKLASFYFIYSAILRTGLMDPFNLLFRDLKQHDEALIDAHKELEKKVEERTLELSESEQRYRELADSLPQVVFEADEKGNLTYANRRAFELFGYTRHDYEAGLSVLQMIMPEDRERAASNFPVVAMGKSEEGGKEYQCLKKNGCSFPSVIYSAPLERNGKFVGLRGIIVNITSLKKAEESLKESEKRYRTLFESSRDALMILAPPSWKFTSGNPATIEIFKVKKETDLTRLGPWDVSPEFQPDGRPSAEKAREMIETAMREGSNFFEWTHMRLDGEKFFATVLLTRIELTDQTVLLATVRDITDQKRIDEQFKQAQKMESVGRLAGGVAHDFNNMLGVILGHAEMALLLVDNTQPIFEDLAEIRKAAERSAALTRQLLAFARKQAIAPKVLDLNETVESMLKMLRRLIGEDISLTWIPHAGLWPIFMDPAQLDQILANLCVNARDAISGVGKVTIETGKIVFDEADCAERTGFMPGEYVLLVVGDNGCGMDKATMDKLFEPFFTTKEIGKGTGLGLATVYGIVKQNNGFINVYSELGKGATFRIYLPRYIGKAEQMQKAGRAEPDLTGDETILLVEDEPGILNITKKMLERQGYNVRAASAPGAAISLAKQHVGEIHLLITDIIMPEMNGQDLTRILLPRYPHLKRLFMSGYTPDIITHQGILEEGVHFIQKPFSIKNLAVKVREALDK